MTNATVHERHSTRFKDTQNPICEKCNYTKEIPRRIKAMKGGKQ